MTSVFLTLLILHGLAVLILLGTVLAINKTPAFMRWLKGWLGL